MAKPFVLEAGAGSLAEFYEWLHRSGHGDVLVYWTGDLQYDRQVQVDPTDPEAHEKQMTVSALNAVADAVLRANAAGFLELTQKRHDVGVYEYRATRLRAGFEKLQLKQFTRNQDANLVLA